MSRHADNVYLNHIFDSIEKIENYTQGFTFEEFQNDNKTIDSVIRNFEIIGEAGNNISDDFKGLHQEIDFRAMISFRNRLAHGYDDIDLQTVWNTLETDLPQLKKQIEILL